MARAVQAQLRSSMQYRLKLEATVEAQAAEARVSRVRRNRKAIIRGSSRIIYIEAAIAAEASIINQQLDDQLIGISNRDMKAAAQIRISR